MKRSYIICAAVTIVVVLFFTVISVPSNPADSRKVVKTGVVSKIDFNDESKDIDIFLDDKVIYYINRGLERGVDKDSLQDAISGKLVHVTYYEPRFDLIGKITRSRSRNVLKIESSGKTVL